MRRLTLTLGALAGLLAAPMASAHSAGSLHGLRSALRQGMGQIGGSSGAYVVDLNTGGALFAWAPGTKRLPASVEKLYTTSTVLERFGPSARLTTSVFGTGRLVNGGVWHGKLYLKGGGDPTFGSAAFDRYAYDGQGATVQELVANLLRSRRITRLHGAIVGDGSYLDSLPSTAESGYRPDPDMEGELSGLAFNRGFADFSGTVYQARPWVQATRKFAAVLRGAGVAVASTTPILTGRAPARAQLLATVSSPRIATLLRLTNTPSDNFMAEMLLKDLGARFGGSGTTAAGARVVRLELKSVFHIHARVSDGSGLSYQDSTSPRQVVRLLEAMAPNKVFVRSLAIGGETGTLQYDMRSRGLRGRCSGKTGSLAEAANLSGYCRARDGHTLAFAFLANSVGNPDYVHSVEANQMAAALVRYDG